MTNVTAVAYGDMPLFLFHLLEFLDVDYEIDVDELNAGWAQPSAIDEWSQFILKDTADVVELITEAPRSGIWRLDPDAHGGISFLREETDWHTVANEGEAFYLRIAQTGRVPLPGRRHRHPRHPRPPPDGRPRADRPRAHVDQRDQAAVPDRPARGGEAPPVRDPEPFSFKML